MTDFRISGILDNIVKLEKQIRVNGVGREQMARYWARLAFFHGKMGDSSQQQFALSKALEFNPDNSFAKTQLTSLQDQQ